MQQRQACEKGMEKGRLKQKEGENKTSGVATLLTPDDPPIQISRAVLICPLSSCVEVWGLALPSLKPACLAEYAEAKDQRITGTLATQRYTTG